MCLFILWFFSGFPETVFVKKTVEERNAVVKDELGSIRNLGQGKPKVPADHAFGIKNVGGSATWNAAKCIHGAPVSEKELMPDPDLGKCTKLGARNVVRFIFKSLFSYIS